VSNPIVYGPSYSAYVRTTRLALEEKGIAYDLVDVAMMAGAHKQPAYLARHPFGKLPAFSHDGLALLPPTIRSTSPPEATARSWPAAHASPCIEHGDGVRIRRVPFRYP
jgi:hypothetical protein